MFLLLIIITVFLQSVSYADSKVSVMTRDTSPSLTDIIYEIKDPDGTPLSRGLAISNVFKPTNITVTGANVGIGSTNPGALLDVLGMVNATNIQAGSILTTSSNVGIGSVSPGTKLDVVGTVRATAFSGDGSALTGVGSGFTHSGSVTYLTNASDNVGINTTTPSRKLEIVNIDSNTTLTTPSLASMGILNQDTTDNSFIDYAMSTVDSLGSQILSSKISGITTSHTSGAVSGAIAFSTKNVGTTAERLRISSAGNVGIGTITPGTPLDVAGNIRIRGGGLPALTFGDDFSMFIVPSATTVGSMRFYANTTEKMRIQPAAGVSAFFLSNVGIGTTSGMGRLEITKSGTVPNILVSSAGGTLGDYFIVNSGGNVGINSTTPTKTLDLGTGSTMRSVGIGTTVPQQLCRKSDGTFGYFDGAWASTCN